MKKIDLIQVFLLGLVALFIFEAWIFSSVIAAGDYWYYFRQMFENHFLYPYSWYTHLGTGLGGQGFAHQSVNMVASIPLELARSFNSNWETLSRIVFFIPFLIISVLSSLFLIKRLFPENKFWLVAPFIFFFNTYILMMVSGGQIITGLSYGVFPVTLCLFMKLIDSRGKWLVSLIILSSLSLSLQTLLDLRIAFVTSIAIVVYFLFSMLRSKLKTSLISGMRVLAALLITALLNSHWLIPILRFGINPIEQLGVDYSSIGIVEFLSFAKLENSIALLHPYWPENIFGKVSFMDPWFLILPILAFSSFLFIKKDNKKLILFFSTLALLGIFLGKGASEPFGNIYLWLFENVPGFQLFRDSFKWYVLTAISFSVLIPYTLDSVSDILERRMNKKYVSGLIFATFFIYFLLLLKPILFNPPGTLADQEVPKEYSNLTNYLEGDKSFYRTLWIPNTMQFSYYTNNHPGVSGRDFFREYDHSKLLDEFSESSEKLDYASVRYVIIPFDSENEIFLTERKHDDAKYQNVVERLDKVEWLRKDKEFGKVVVYKTQENKDHFWSPNGVSVSYKFINPTQYDLIIENAKKGDLLVFSESFDKEWAMKIDGNERNSQLFEGKFNSFELAKNGDYRAEVFYKPQKLVDKSFILSISTLGILLIIFLINLVLGRKNDKI